MTSSEKFFIHYCEIFRCLNTFMWLDMLIYINKKLCGKHNGKHNFQWKMILLIFSSWNGREREREWKRERPLTIMYFKSRTRHDNWNWNYYSLVFFVLHRQHIHFTDIFFPLAKYVCPIIVSRFIAPFYFSMSKSQSIIFNSIVINTNKLVQKKNIKVQFKRKLDLPINKYWTNDENDHDGAQYHGENSISRKSCIKH